MFEFAQSAALYLTATIGTIALLALGFRVTEWAIDRAVKAFGVFSLVIQFMLDRDKYRRLLADHSRTEEQLMRVGRKHVLACVDIQITDGQVTREWFERHRVAMREGRDVHVRKDFSDE